MATAWFAFVLYEFHATLRFAGSCRPNPGHGSIGFLLYNYGDGTVLEKFSTYVNDCFAHYKALIAGLQHALWRGITHITALGHCELLIHQVKGNCGVDKPSLKRYRKRVRQLASQFASFKLEHIYSQDNSDARSLARAGFHTIFVDPIYQALWEILYWCHDPDSAKNYVLDQRCDGYHKTKYILDTIECYLPESFAAIQKLCTNISRRIIRRSLRLENNRARACLLGIYYGFCIGQGSEGFCHFDRLQCHFDRLQSPPFLVAGYEATGFE